MASSLKYMTTFAVTFGLLFAFLPTSDAKKIIVGGTQNWKFGFNYTDWAIKTGPFHVGDILVFKYKPTVFQNITVNHNVLRLHSRKQLKGCSFYKATLLAGIDGGDPGYEFELKEKMPHYFACGIDAGVHCSTGMMKFAVHAH